MQTTIDTLHGSCRLADGSDDPAKGNQLLEVYGITIQLCTATNNNALMKQVRLLLILSRSSRAYAMPWGPRAVVCVRTCICVCVCSFCEHLPRYPANQRTDVSSVVAGRKK